VVNPPKRGGTPAMPIEASRKTTLCHLLGIEHPIIAAPMGPDLTGPELVAAVSNAGALGHPFEEFLLEFDKNGEGHPIGSGLSRLRILPDVIRHICPDDP
jgi:hypothetical protein